MKEMEVYVHTPDSPEPKLVTVREDMTAKDLIEKIKSLGLLGNEPSEDLHLFLDDDEVVIEREKRLCDCGCHHRKHVHCHRCRRAKVTVTYNGRDIDRAFAPSTRIRRIRAWATREFALSETDAAETVLRLADKPDSDLPDDAHIGSFVKFPVCAVRLALVVKVAVQG